MLDVLKRWFGSAVTNESILYFSPTKDFWNEQFRSQYIQGLQYHAHPKSALYPVALQWIQEGKAKAVRAASSIQGY